MVVELIVSGLCAFVLSPCGANPTSVSAVFPGGPFSFPSGESYPEHKPMLIVDITDIDPTSTAMPEGIVEEPGGIQYAFFNLEGEITLTLDETGAPPSVTIGTSFKGGVTSLSEVVTGKPKLGELRSDLLSPGGNDYSRAHLTLPLKVSSPSLEVISPMGKYDFPAKTLEASDRVHVQWSVAAKSTVVFTSRGKSIRLRDYPKLSDGKIRVVLTSFSPHIGEPMDDLMHFPMYYFLSSYDLKKITKAERAVPKKHVVSGGPQPAAARPVACAICVGCE